MLRKLFTMLVCLMAAVATASAQTPPNNEIWYTTTDGRTISFNDDNLVSNSYNNGRGVLKFRDSLISFGKWAFRDCSSLKSITIPNSVTSIGEWAFEYCSSLTSITIPNSVTSIGKGAFSGCSSLKSITIPNNVTSIDSYAFEDCSSLKSITIPNSVTSIGYEAFKGCSSLTSITIPNSVTSINSGAFKGCSSLTSITIPNSETSIVATFSGCSSLTSITIPNSVTSIGESAFYDCSSLKSITIPNSVTSIGESAFRGCSSLTSITIPNSVTSIGEEAFYGCSSLTSITIPNSVTSIGNYAFFCCDSLTSITIPNSVKSIGRYAFYGCSSLTSITIPNSVTEIGDEAFKYCSSLTSITIPNSVTSIEESAFRDCSSLKSVKVASEFCYDYFKKLGVSDITFAVSTLEEYEEAQKLGATKLAIDSNSKYASGDGLCLIDNGKLILFIGKDLTEYTIPESVTSFREEVFKDCSNLKSVTVANEYCYDYFKDKVANIAFYGANASDDGRCLIIDGELKIFIAKGVTEYTIPESVTSIEYGAFNDCSKLKSVKVSNKYCYYYFKDKVANIAFYGANASDDGRCLIIGGKLERFIAKGITEYTIPNGVTSLGEAVFKECSNLTSITIPNSVKSIGYEAFKGCSSLTSITIPDSVTSIGNHAFKYCSSLTSITCLATTPPAIDYLGIAETTMIYVSKEAVKAYKKDPKWSIYKKQIKRIK